nr:hypothetical protein [Blastococcus sp. KM273128]
MSSSATRTAALPVPTTALVTICTGSPESRPKASQERLSATASQALVGERPRVRRCRQERQTWGQTTAMLRVAARMPRTADMVERGSVRSRCEERAPGTSCGTLADERQGPAVTGDVIGVMHP